jgi:aspartyl protease family protein
MPPRTWALAATLWACGALSHAQHSGQGVALSGSLGASKALLVIDGQPHTVEVGSTVKGVKLLSLAGGQAQVEVKGQRHVLRLGAAQLGEARSDDAGGSKIVLSAGPGGHFIAGGAINGQAAQFVVDTGATSVVLSQQEAERMGLDYRKGPQGTVSTANGLVPVHSMTLTQVQVGDVKVYNVAAMVVPAPMPFVLLGNSFLNRFSMKREGDTMTLERRY